MSSSWLRLLRRQNLPQLRQPRTDTRLDGSEWLIQPSRHFRISELGKKCALDRLSLIWREGGQGNSQQTLPFSNIKDFLGAALNLLGDRAFPKRVHALFT